MSASSGEGAQSGIDFDALLQLQNPIIELMDPKTAPLDMLEQVRVNTEGRCLETTTPLGTIAVEMYWKKEDGEEVRGDFFPALSSEVDPDATANPLATQAYPYTILPDGSLYEIVVRAPLSVFDAEWSEERSVPITGGEFSLLKSVSLAQFRQAYPSVEVDLPEGQYTITATERTKPTIAVAARVENGEPLVRMQEIRGKTVRYKETSAGGFLRSGLRPDTAVTVLDSRTTIRDGGQADRQRLEFKAHDGFQRTGEGAAENSGLAEIIVMQAEAVDLTDFTFTPYAPPLRLRSTYDDFGFGGNFFGGTRKNPATFGGDSEGFRGLIGGETRYRPPEKIRVDLVGSRNMRAVAAFRFAMTCSQESSPLST